MTSISKNVCVDKLDDIVNICNKYPSTIKMKPVNVKTNMYIDFGKESNNKDPRFKTGDIIGTSKYKFCN